MVNEPARLRVTRTSVTEADALPAETAPGDSSPAGDDAVWARLAELVEKTGLVPADRLDELKNHARGGSFAEAILNAGLAPGALAERFGLPLVNAAAIEVDQDAAEQIPFHILERACALPYRVQHDRLSIVVADPSDVQTMGELRLATRYQLDVGVGSRDDIGIQLRNLSRAQEVWERAVLVEDDVLVVEAEPDVTELEADDGVSDALLVRLVNSLVLQAAEDGASDLHFVPQEDAFVVRQRVDGVLHEVQRLPRRLGRSVLTRLKVLAKLDIAERRKPQDGRITLSPRTAGRELDIRVAVLPTVEGESSVMRLLDKSKRPPSLEEIGFSDRMRATIEQLIERPTGALLVTGPTGSGKSTTLYAALNALNRPDVNIITVEDPVEYRLPGVGQVQINHKAGLSFALALRTILRSDPDVIMVGEIRDSETAKMAVESALTGHFVLSTLHTNDAPSVLSRLNEMGVEPFLTGSAITAVLAQRLVRRLCQHCSQVYVPTDGELATIRLPDDRLETIRGESMYRKQGCSRCNDTGYRGRVGIFQLMVMREELQRAALAGGTGTLWDDGLAKVSKGMTSLEELHRILG